LRIKIHQGYVAAPRLLGVLLVTEIWNNWYLSVPRSYDVSWYLSVPRMW